MPEGKQSIISKSRREFIRGSLAARTSHIASLLIQGRPEELDNIVAALTAIDGVESHGSPSVGKLIVTLETENDAGLVDAMNRIQVTPGVITASLVYHQMEDGAPNEGDVS